MIVDQQTCVEARLRTCAFARALGQIGDRWTLLIIQGVAGGVEHYEDLQAHLAIARNILADRLQSLVCDGILKREVVSEDKRKARYSLTEKGTDLLPLLAAVNAWGEKWAAPGLAECGPRARQSRYRGAVRRASIAEPYQC